MKEKNLRTILYFGFVIIIFTILWVADNPNILSYSNYRASESRSSNFTTTGKSDIVYWYEKDETYKIREYVSENIQGKNVNELVIHAILSHNKYGISASRREITDYTSTSKSDLNYWYEEKETYKISNYISENIRSKYAGELVVHAIQLLGDAGADSTLRQFGSLIGEDISTEYTQALVEVLKEQSLVPRSPAPFCEMVTSGDHSGYEGIEKILMSFRDPALSACVAKSLEESYISFDAAEVMDAIDQVDELTPDLPESLERIQSQAKILEYDRKLEERIEDKEREISQLESRISDQLESIEDTKRLRAYVVGLENKEVVEGKVVEVYEFAFTYRGRPTKKRGYLATTETSFESKKLFEMRVRKLREVETKIKKEFGGFEQSWPLYIEVRDYESAREQLVKWREEKSELEKKVDRIKEKKLSTRKEYKEEEIEKKLENKIKSLSKKFESKYEDKVDNMAIKKGKKEIGKVRKNRRYKTLGSVPLRGMADEAEVRILRDTVTEKRLVAWVGPEVTDTLSQSFNDSTVIGPFRRFEKKDGLLFKTADSKWRVLHFWSPGRDVHAWRVTDRRTGEIRKSDNYNQYPEVDSLLASNPSLPRGQELKDQP